MSTVAEDYRIPVENMPKLTEAFRKLTVKAKRLGCEPPRLTVLRDETDIEEHKDGTMTAHIYSVVAVGGEAPTYRGWSFVATLEWDDDLKMNVVRRLPGIGYGVYAEENLTRYRTAPPVCDHCRLNRNRKDTYVLMHQGGGFAQVGSNCIKDFLGYHADPEQLCFMAEMLAQVHEYCANMGGHGAPLWTTDTFVAMTAACIRRFGWTSRAKAQELHEQGYGATPTVNYVYKALEDNRTHGIHGDGDRCFTQYCDWTEMNGHVGITEADTTHADKALKWVRSMEPESLNDYLFNLYVACKGEALVDRRAGLAASLIAAYDRAMEKERTRILSAGPDAGYYGEVKKRYTLDLMVERVDAITTNFGVTMKHKMTDAEGHVFIWWASSGELKAGEEVRVKATVKEHREYKGYKQTVVTRVAEV